MGQESILQMTVQGQLSRPQINLAMAFDRFHSVFLGVFVVLYICFISSKRRVGNLDEGISDTANTSCSDPSFPLEAALCIVRLLISRVHTLLPWLTGTRRERLAYRKPLWAVLEDPPLRVQGLQSSTRYHNLSATLRFSLMLKNRKQTLLSDGYSTAHDNGR